MPVHPVTYTEKVNQTTHTVSLSEDISNFNEYKALYDKTDQGINFVVGTRYNGQTTELVPVFGTPRRHGEYEDAIAADPVFQNITLTAASAYGVLAITKNMIQLTVRQMGAGTSVFGKNISQTEIFMREVFGRINPTIFGGFTSVIFQDGLQGAQYLGEYDLRTQKVTYF